MVTSGLRHQKFEFCVIKHSIYREIQIKNEQSSLDVQITFRVDIAGTLDPSSACELPHR